MNIWGLQFLCSIYKFNKAYVLANLEACIMMCMHIFNHICIMAINVNRNTCQFDIRCFILEYFEDSRGCQIGNQDMVT